MRYDAPALIARYIFCNVVFKLSNDHVLKTQNLNRRRI